VQLRADVLGLDSAGDQVQLLSEKIRLLQDALIGASEQFGINSLAAQQVREQLLPLQEQYDAMIAQQEQQQQVLSTVNAAFAQGASIANKSADEQRSALESVGLAAIAAAAQVVKAELQKAVAAYISSSIITTGLGGLILAAGAFFQ